MSGPPEDREDAHADDQPHGHGGHGHGLAGGWSRWLRHPILRVLLGIVVLVGVATVIGVVWLWPDGAGRRDVQSEAAQLGLVSDRLDATVESVTDGPCSYSTDELPQQCRLVLVVPASGPDEGLPVALPEFSLIQGAVVPDVAPGDEIILGYEASTDFYFYADLNRRDALMWLVVAFAVVVVLLGRWRGALALVSMAVTVIVLIGWVAPGVLDGHDPLLVSVVAASVIAYTGLYLTHGFSPTTTVALTGTLAALALTLLISAVFFDALRFTGLATEEGLTLPLIAEGIDLTGLLLGGAIIGALGALDDVTITQVATVAELHDRQPELSRRQLMSSGIRVGREHIASTVNTLLLAYVGASMPLLLLFAVSDQGLSTVANAELIAVEIARTLCGSIGLVAAVPLTTALAALVVADAGPPMPSAGRPVGERPDQDPSWSQFAPKEEPRWT